MYPAARFCLRVFWLARLAAAALDKGARVSGHAWQAGVYRAALSLRDVDVQGPGHGTLFGKTGSSGLHMEIDTAFRDGAGTTTLVESKAYEDYTLSRDAAFVFSCKVRDHEEVAGRNRIIALLASGGRVDSIIARACYREGIDIVAPDRLPVLFLLDLPYSLEIAFRLLAEPHFFDWLCELLPAEDERLPSLRTADARRRLTRDRLVDLNYVQLRLTELVIEALSVTYPHPTIEAREEHLLKDVGSRLANIGVELVVAD